MTLTPLGDSALVLALGETVDEAMLARVQALVAEIERHRPKGVVDVVPAFATVTVFYDIAQVANFAALQTELAALAMRADAGVVRAEPQTVEIPVCYGGEFGPDLANVGERAGLAVAEVAALHSGADYRVHAIGFAPGFGYLAGLPERLNAPRRATPRLRVPAGAVGIGGNQTGIYPLATPGGWNLIGRTPLTLFDPARPDPALLHAGDRVKFRQIRAGEFEKIRAQQTHGDADEFMLVGENVALVEVGRAGMLTTVQDAGRVGHRARGVPRSGAADTFALRLANLLVGNAENAAGLEFTLVGPMLTFPRETLIAIGGVEVEGAPSWQPFVVAAGETLDLRAVRRGSRGYVAFAGGVKTPRVLGSRSTYARAGLGGLLGRALQEGDLLPIAGVARHPRGHWHIDPRVLPEYSATPTVRVVRGAQVDEFGAAFFSQAFRVSAQADRMGMRLMGSPLARQANQELRSATVVPGTVQVPADGQPIILLADAQTIGGYPQIGHVISTDLPLVAQLRAGDTVRFREVSLDEAHALGLAREHALAMLREGLAVKFT
jgi:KipI family sensor histidine kinase inhibitor